MLIFSEFAFYVHQAKNGNTFKHAQYTNANAMNRTLTRFSSMNNLFISKSSHQASKSAN